MKLNKPMKKKEKKTKEMESEHQYARIYIIYLWPVTDDEKKNINKIITDIIINKTIYIFEG